VAALLAAAVAVQKAGTATASPDELVEAEIIDHCRPHLAAYKRPRSVRFVPDLPKTSTGKVTPAATLPVTLVMLEAVRDFRDARGRQVGVKPAGGIRTAKDAIRYLVLVNETAGEDWLDPRWFRFGASSLLNDLLMQRARMETGRYSGPDYMTVD
jgi:hypothetical protein